MINVLKRDMKNQVSEVDPETVKDLSLTLKEVIEISWSGPYKHHKWMNVLMMNTHSSGYDTNLHEPAKHALSLCGGDLKVFKHNIPIEHRQCLYMTPSFIDYMEPWLGHDAARLCEIFVDICEESSPLHLIPLARMMIDRNADVVVPILTHMFSEDHKRSKGELYAKIAKTNDLRIVNIVSLSDMLCILSGLKDQGVDLLCALQSCCVWRMHRDDVPTLVERLKTFCGSVSDRQLLMMCTGYCPPPLLWKFRTDVSGKDMLTKVLGAVRGRNMGKGELAYHYAHYTRLDAFDDKLIAQIIKKLDSSYVMKIFKLINLSEITVRKHRDLLIRNKMRFIYDDC